MWDTNNWLVKYTWFWLHGLIKVKISFFNALSYESYLKQIQNMLQSYRVVIVHTSILCISVLPNRSCWGGMQKIENRLWLYRNGSRHTIRNNLSGMEFSDSAFTLPYQSPWELLQEPGSWTCSLVLHYRSEQALGALQHLRLW